MFAIVFACILGFVVTAGSDAYKMPLNEDGFVALLVQEQAGCGNGDEFKAGDDMSIQECADHCGGAGTIFFAHKSDGGACWCAGVENEEGGVCGWSSVGTSEYNVYIAASTSEDVDTTNGDAATVPESEVQARIDAAVAAAVREERAPVGDAINWLCPYYEKATLRSTAYGSERLDKICAASCNDRQGISPWCCAREDISHPYVHRCD